MIFSDFTLEKWIEGLQDFLPRLALALLILVIARLIASGLKRFIRRSMEARERDPELILLLQMLTHWGILAIGVVLAAEQIAPGRFSSLIAGLGVAGVTIGFALQDVAKNFIAGILLLIQQPFEIGDDIEVKGYGGKVVEISLRSTDIRTFDGRHVIIPNTDVFINPIINFSRATRRRVELTVGVAPDSDLDRVTRVAMSALQQNVEGILQDPPTRIIFSNFGEFTIDFTAYYWVDTVEYDFLDAKHQGVQTIKVAFEREAIEMPYPTYVTIQANP